MLVGKRHTSNALWLGCGTKNKLTIVRYNGQKAVVCCTPTDGAQTSGRFEYYMGQICHFDLIVAFYLLLCLYLSVR